MIALLVSESDRKKTVSILDKRSRASVVEKDQFPRQVSGYLGLVPMFVYTTTRNEPCFGIQASQTASCALLLARQKLSSSDWKADKVRNQGASPIDGARIVTPTQCIDETDPQPLARRYTYCF
jgi:hypothetical protein